MIVFIVKLQQTADENLFCVHKYCNELCNNETLVVYFFPPVPFMKMLIKPAQEMLNKLRYVLLCLVFCT